MELAIVSFLAGVLTVITPCVLPILPIILGGTLANSQDKKRPFIIVFSLAFSVLAFSLLLKSSTLLINISPDFWKYFSGGIILVFGVFTLFPAIWEKISENTGLSGSNSFLQQSSQRGGVLGQVLIGLSLGPVFSSCSPTYAVILAVVLPQSFALGFANLLIYTLGLASSLLTIAVFGQGAISKLKWAANPNGWFRKALGVLFLLVGIAIITGYDKKLEIALLENGLYDFTRIDQQLIDRVNMKEPVDIAEPTSEVPLGNASEYKLNVVKPYLAPELNGITNWINSEPLTMSDLRGKVVLVDFWTYSCINCIRTLPHLKSWHEAYADDGLVIIGVHAPEFSFERKVENVLKAVDDFEIEYPVALDNDFSTWRSYNNHYWPAKYFIDSKGFVRHFHYGEGEYQESEEVIKYLLSEAGADANPQESELPPELKESLSPPISRLQSPETYLGYKRAKDFVNISEFEPDQTVNYSLRTLLLPNQWSLGGQWSIENEKSVSQEDNAKLAILFSAKDVYLVMGTSSGLPAEVGINVVGFEFDPEAKSGSRIVDGKLTVDEFKLYDVVNLSEFEKDALLELTFPKGVEVHAFTFGS